MIKGTIKVYDKRGRRISQKEYNGVYQRKNFMKIWEGNGYFFQIHPSTNSRISRDGTNKKPKKLAKEDSGRNMKCGIEPAAVNSD